MFRHLITSIDYTKFIEMQANATHPLDRNSSKKMKKVKSQSKSKSMVKRMNMTKNK